VTHFRTGLDPMVPGTTILGNFVNILILGKKNHFFEACSGLGIETTSTSLFLLIIQGASILAEHFHLSLVIRITLVKGQKCSVLAYNEKHLSHEQPHLCRKVLLSTALLHEGILSSIQYH